MIRVFAGDFAAQLITSEAKNYERFAHEWDSRGTVACAWTNKSEIRRARSRRVQDGANPRRKAV